MKRLRILAGKGGGIVSGRSATRVRGRARARGVSQWEGGTDDVSEPLIDRRHKFKLWLTRVSRDQGSDAEPSSVRRVHVDGQCKSSPCYDKLCLAEDSEPGTLPDRVDPLGRSHDNLISESGLLDRSCKSGLSLETIEDNSGTSREGLAARQHVADPDKRSGLASPITRSTFWTFRS